MELMTMKTALEMVDKYKRIYPKDYKDIILENGGRPFKNEKGGNLKLGELETAILKEKPNMKMMGLSTDEIVIFIDKELWLNEYQLLDSCTLNINCAFYGLEFS